MTLAQLTDFVQPPPVPKILDYPGFTGALFGVLFTSILLVVAGKFDPTHGALTISLLVTLAFIGVATYCMLFTIPKDDITPGVIGGLTAAFGAVVSFWLNHPRRNGDDKK